MRKPVFGISAQVRHKPACTATEDALGLEISDLGSRAIVLSKGDDREADLRLCFRICQKKNGFLITRKMGKMYYKLYINSNFPRRLLDWITIDISFIN